LTERLSEVLKEKELLEKQTVSLKENMLQIEKFDSAIIEKNLDLQEQIQSLEQKQKNMIFENSHAVENTAVGFNIAIGKLEKVVENVKVRIN
jgi:hypothetical protein